MTPQKTDMPVEIYDGGYTKGAIGYCSHGKWAGWIFWKHPDGQWVSLCKIPERTAHKSREAELLACIEKMHAAYSRDIERAIQIMAELGRHCDPASSMVAQMEKVTGYADIIKQAKGE